MIAQDLNEQQLLEHLAAKDKAKIVITPIGGQGFLFGRGNQQVSPEVIGLVGRENVIVAATPGKLQALQGRPLLVDTGDEKVNKLLSGHIRVITGYHQAAVCKVAF